MRKEIPLTINIVFLLVFSFLLLRSIAPFVFPPYYFYFLVGIIVFTIFSSIDFSVLGIFHKQLYVMSLLLLLVPLIVGQVTRGVVRWIPIGSITLQPSELVRPFLLLFFAYFLNAKHPNFKRFVYSGIFLAIPVLMIIIQPSLGVAILTCVGYLGILIASDFDKRKLFMVIGSVVVLLPVIWLVLAPYQKTRILQFISPSNDPAGAGYNSTQSMISVGSGKLWGRGLGQGVQTQLSFLPERHTDFIFASVAEEMGFVGAGILMLAIILLLFRITQILAKTASKEARMFISGVFLSFLAQTLVHIGMNMGMLPITGVPLPLVSAGGSSLLATLISLGIIISCLSKQLSIKYQGRYEIRRNSSTRSPI